MKKIISTLLILALCLGLCACGSEKEEIVLPTKPQQMTVPSLPAGESQSDAAEESTETADPTGETFPWEAEFREEDYSRHEGIIDNVGDVVVWKENGFSSPTRRQLVYQYDGDMDDNYYYPNGTFSHTYFYGADGTYIENHYLDNGRIEIEGNNSIMYAGTNVYYKHINPDGSYQETKCAENGNPMYSIEQHANGYYSEFRYHDNGNPRKIIIIDPASETHQEEEYYENGSMKCIKSQTPEHTTEEQYDEEGFHTYFYSKNADYEIELTADEAGKLVKVIENGNIIEDAATLAQYAQSYNFRQ